MRRKSFYLVEKSINISIAIEEYYITIDCRNPLIDVEKSENN